MKTRHLALSLLIGSMVLGSPGAFAAHEVKFATGTSSATVEGGVKGYDVETYVLGAKAGQEMKVSLQADNDGCAFYVYARGSKEPLYDGSLSGNAYSGIITESGSYSVKVGLGRNDAREGRSCKFTLAFAIAAAKGASESDALVPRTHYHATGEIDCSFSGDAATKSCPFGVVRAGSGNAAVDITLPNGVKRVLEFHEGRISTPKLDAVTSTRKGDNTIVSVNGLEQFVIPDIIVEGD